MIPRPLMIQGEFKLEVWTLIIEKSTVIPPSLMVLFLYVVRTINFFPHLHNCSIFPQSKINAIHLSDEERGGSYKERCPVHVHSCSNRKNKPFWEESK